MQKGNYKPIWLLFQESPASGYIYTFIAFSVVISCYGDSAGQNQPV